MGKRLYDNTGAARYLKITPSAVTQHVAKGHINTTWCGHLGSAGRMMFREVDLLTFIYSDYYVGVKSGYDKPGSEDVE